MQDITHVDNIRVCILHSVYKLWRKDFKRTRKRRFIVFPRAFIKHLMYELLTHPSPSTNPGVCTLQFLHPSSPFGCTSLCSFILTTLRSFQTALFRLPTYFIFFFRNHFLSLSQRTRHTLCHC